jgi:hypothetical protein
MQNKQTTVKQQENGVFRGKHLKVVITKPELTPTLHGNCYLCGLNNRMEYQFSAISSNKRLNFSPAQGGVPVTWRNMCSL